MKNASNNKLKDRKNKEIENLLNTDSSFLKKLIEEEVDDSNTFEDKETNSYIHNRIDY